MKRVFKNIVKFAIYSLFLIVVIFIFFRLGDNESYALDNSTNYLGDYVLNPEWIEYMELSDEDKNYMEIIPEKFIYRYKKEWYCAQMYFIPEEVAEQKQKEDKVPYKVWKEQGYVRFCSGNKVRETDITEWFVELREKYSIYTLWVGYDPWGANLWVEDMKKNSFTMEEVRQGAKTMSTPMKQLSCELSSKNINYNNNPILKWCLTNTQVEIDKNENIRPIKGKNKKQRIDGAVALIDAFVVLQNHYEDYMTMSNL